MKKIIFVFVMCVTALSVFGQPPGYYTAALGKNGAQLKTALHNIIDNHSTQSFPLWSFFATTDNKGSNILWDVYSDLPGGMPSYTYQIGTDQCGSYNSEADCYNHEHLWPKTYFNDVAPMNSDLHQVYPTDGWVNNKRGSFPFGKVSAPNYTSNNGSQTGSSSTYLGYSGSVFEPIDSFKGDIARVFFYMSTRYEGEDNGWNNWEMANKAELKNDAIQLLLQWHKDDPVSQKEITRNNAVYAVQNNRNPFIDYPVFVDCIWGTADCTPLSTEDVLLASIKIFPNPADDILHINVPTQWQQTALRYQVYNTHGVRVLSGTKTELDISQLANGLYNLYITHNAQSASISFVKK